MSAKRVHDKLAVVGAVLFDLFGTLVGPFSRAGNTAALQRCAELAGLDPDQCVTRWIDLYDKRVRGEVAGIRGHLDVCASAAGLRIDSSTMAAAEESYGAFVSDLLEPAANAIEFLRAIADAGHRVGVLSNCHHDVARIVRDGPFGALVEFVNRDWPHRARLIWPHPGHVFLRGRLVRVVRSR